MNWKQLLSAKRWGYEHRDVTDPLDARSEFQRDYDRLIFFHRPFGGYKTKRKSSHYLGLYLCIID